MSYKSMSTVLYNQAIEKPDHMACVFLENGLDETYKITYHQLYHDAKIIAAALQNAGVRIGDRVVLIFVPGLDLIRAFWGCLYAGAIAVLVYPPVNKKLMEKTHRIIHDSSPEIILLSKNTSQRYAALFDKGEYLATNKQAAIIEFETIFNTTQPDWEEPKIMLDTVALLQYTSGSTNYPKGVMVTHGNLIDNLEKIKRAFGMTANSIMFGWLPPYHDMGLMGNILSPIYTGYPTYLMTSFSFLQNPLAWLKSITQFKVTISGSPNFAYDYCVKRIKEERKKELDLSSWEVAFNGAEPVHHSTMERFYDAFKAYGFRKEAFYPCYGLAETTLLAASGEPLEAYQILDIKKEQLQDHRVQIVSQSTNESYRLVSCGSLHHDIQIVDPDTFEACDPDVIGEIWIRGDSVAEGYWNQPEETQLIFEGKIKNHPKRESYLRTGDLGFIHDNELYVTGRIKDLIILYGKNYYPQDIEASLKYCSFHELLGILAAFVKSNNNEYLLTVVCELKNQALEDQEREQLCNKIFELVYQEHTLEVHKIVLVRRNSIPQTTSGKVKRRLCREMLEKGELPVLYIWGLEEQPLS